MAGNGSALSLERVALIRWTARMGAVVAPSLALVADVSQSTARARLRAAEREGLLTSSRPLAGQPALYALTAAGMRCCGLRGLDRCRVTASNATHLVACVAVAAALERGYPEYRVLGERELRRDERERGAALASAQVGIGAQGEPLLHRPDLVLWPERHTDGLPVAVEVELTIKAPRRLTDICRAWARCREVSGVLYVAPPEVERALKRAIARAQARERIVVVGPDALPTYPPAAFGLGAGWECPENTVPSDA